MNSASPSVPTRGRPRSAAARDAVLAAAFDLLVERGFPHLTMEHVAKRAGVGKATVYRWWPDRSALAVDAFFETTRDSLRFPDTGSARGDFHAQIVDLADLLRGPTGGGMRGMVVGMVSDPALQRAVIERWIAPRRAWGMARMEAARLAGELPAGLAVEAALSALYSPLYAPLFFGFGVPDAAQVDAYLAIVLTGIFGHKV